MQSARGVALAVRVERNRARPGGGSVGFLEKTFRFGATAITICATLDKELNLQLKLAPMLPTDHEAPSPTLSPDSDELEQIGRSYLGHRVSAYWGGDRCWYSGTIIGEAGDVLNVRYDDQEEGEVHIGTDIFVVDRSGSGPGASDSKSRRRRKSWTAAFTRMFSAGARKDKRKKIHTEGMEPASSAPSTAREPEVQPLPCSTPLARCASEPYHRRCCSQGYIHG